jgi:hypothetical protein
MRSVHSDVEVTVRDGEAPRVRSCVCLDF